MRYDILNQFSDFEISEYFLRQLNFVQYLRKYLNRSKASNACLRQNFVPQ